MNNKYQIYICSTYSDLIEERKAVSEAILNLYQNPIGMESFPASSENVFEVTQRFIDDSDYFILIIGRIYGSITQNGISHVEEQYNYAVTKKKKILVFIQDVNVNEESLDRFRNRLSEKHLALRWKDIDELRFKVISSLSQVLLMNNENTNKSTDMPNQSNITSYIDELKNTLGLYTSKENSDIIGLMADNLNEIRQFYQLTKEQANNAYKLAKNSSIAGIGLIVLSVLTALIFDNNQIAIATTVGGVIVEVLAGTSLFVYQKTLKQLNYYYASLHNNERFLSLINIVGKTNIKDELYSKIVESELDNLKQYEIKNDNTQ